MRLRFFIPLSFFVFLVGVGIRFYYLFALNAYPQYFYNGAPLLNTHDGYFYAQGAKELLNLYQEYIHNSTWNLWQHTKDIFEIPNSPALSKSANEILSKLTALLALCSPLSLEQIFFFLPAVFGSLIVFPIMALTRHFGAIPCALSGLLSAISVGYYNRTLLGYYDTDMLVIVLGVGVGVMILRTLATQRTLDCAILFALSVFALGYYSNLRYILLGYIFILLLFLMESLYKKSDERFLIQAIIAGLILTLLLEILAPNLTFLWVLLGIALGFALNFYRKVNLKLFILCALGFLFWRILPSMLKSDYLGGFFSKNTSENPNANLHYLDVLSTIAEVSSINFSEFAYRVSGGILWLILGALGYIWLVLRYKKYLLFLPFLALGCFAFLQGLRFSFYAIPLFVLGLSFLLFQTQEILKFFKFRILKSLLLLSLSCFAILPHLSHIRHYVVAPILEKSEAEILHSLNAQKGDFALAWWDYGYFVSYFSGLKTFIDGGKHSGAQNFPISLALSTKEETTSYNIAKMLLSGESLESYLQNLGIAETLEILKTKQTFAESQNALYFILPWRMLEIFPSIMRFSQIDLTNGKIPKLDFFALSISEKNEMVEFKNGIKLNKNTGEVLSQDFNTTIQKSIDLQNHTTQSFDDTSTLMAIFLPNGKTLLCAESYLETFYFKGLFFEQLDKNLFQKVLKNDKITIYKLL